MSFASLVKRGASIAIELPSHLESISVVIEQKVKAEAEALERAVTPELEEDMGKIVSFLEAHVDGLSALSKAHNALASAEKAVMSEIESLVTPATPAPAPVSPGSDAVPTTPVF